MARFDDILEELKNPDNSDKFDKFYGELYAEYESAANKLSSQDAKIAELTESNTNIEVELLKTKASNYDLLKSIPDNNEKAPAKQDPETPSTIEELFN